MGSSSAYNVRFPSVWARRSPTMFTFRRFGLVVALQCSLSVGLSQEHFPLVVDAKNTGGVSYWPGPVRFLIRSLRTGEGDVGMFHGSVHRSKELNG
ncbi:hypothetical protein HMPREF9012_1249 [Bacteroidetes bacterium oral taxon 272 str. F0290]|nr:hypothetical protein HMPREF9012_1249 [Bacteroidetes bacterium oral taxon 272 str. F0290]